MALGLFGLVLFCYWPALRGAILWDDPAHIPRPDLQSWAGLARIWTDIRATQQYYPVLFSAFWMEHRLWGEVPAGAAWWAASLFAVHPVCVESVAWITEQKNTLSLVFYLAAALVYLDFVARRRARSYIFATLLFLGALGSKTVTVTLPVALLLVLWWKQGRLAGRRDVLPLVPWFGFSLVSGLLTSYLERTFIGADVVVFHLTAVQRLLLAGRVAWFYVGKLVWPFDLNFFYPKWDVAAEAAGWAGYVGAGIAVTAGLWALRRRVPGALTAWLVYLAGLFPILGFFKVFFFGFTYVNDHFQYLPMLGMLAGAAGGAALLLERAPRGVRRAGLALGAVVVATLALASHRQSRLYRDNETLARDVIARNPASWIAREILATTLAKAPDRHAEAIAEFEEVLRLNPDFAEAHYGLGVELARLPGRRADALAAYARALELRPDFAEAHNNLGLMLAADPNRRADAIAHFEAALRVKPDHALAHANLADVLVKSADRLPEAMAHYHEALRLRPDLVWVRCHFAFLLSHLPGKQEEALAQYAEALRLDPDSIDAHNGLAIAYVMLGRTADARREWETVLRLDPGQEAARRNLRRLDEHAGR
jgi:tetratricopeptide (TPR) repeat protein